MSPPWTLSRTHPFPTAEPTENIWKQHGTPIFWVCKMVIFKSSTGKRPLFWWFRCVNFVEPDVEPVRWPWGCQGRKTEGPQPKIRHVGNVNGVSTDGWGVVVSSPPTMSSWKCLCILFISVLCWLRGCYIRPSNRTNMRHMFGIKQMTQVLHTFTTFLQCACLNILLQETDRPQTNLNIKLWAWEEMHQNTGAFRRSISCRKLLHRVSALQIQASSRNSINTQHIYCNLCTSSNNTIEA